MNSYIANSRIATGLRDGSITAIMVRCKPQPDNYNFMSSTMDELCKEYFGDFPHKMRYEIDKEVYVREAWNRILMDNEDCDAYYRYFYLGDTMPLKSATTMPKEAARTWITPVSVECKRVQDISETNLKDLGYLKKQEDLDQFDLDQIDINQTIYKCLGQQAWDNNEYVFIYQVKTRIA